MTGVIHLITPVVFMDEIHLRPEYTDSNGRMSQDQMIVDLTTHGHQNKDIYLITQDPERLNRGIRKLVEKMYLLKRPPSCRLSLLFMFLVVGFVIRGKQLRTLIIITTITFSSSIKMAGMKVLQNIHQ